jgi:Tol biopolymer transport system component
MVVMSGLLPLFALREPVGASGAAAPNCIERSDIRFGDPPVQVISYGGPMSADGRYVTSTSEGSPPGIADTNGSIQDAFVRDTDANTIELVSRRTDGAQIDDSTSPIALSDDGRYVLLRSGGPLDPNDSNGKADIYLRDRQLNTTTLISGAPGGGSNSHGGNDGVITPDGRYIAYVTQASLTAADTNGQPDIYRLDRQTGTRTLVSLGADGAVFPDGGSIPSMSTDGDRIVVHTPTPVPGAEGPDRSIVVRTVSTASTQPVGNGLAFLATQSNELMLSTYAALSPFDGNGQMDIYAINLATSSATWVTNRTFGLPSGNAAMPVPSPNGRYVSTFIGVAPNMYQIDRQNQTGAWVGVLESPSVYAANEPILSGTSALHAYVYRAPVAAIVTATQYTFARGTTTQVTLPGRNLFAGTTFDAGTGVTATAVTPLGSSIVVEVTVAANAAIGSRPFTTISTSGCRSTASNLLLITSGSTPPPSTTTPPSSTTTTRPPTTTSQPPTTPPSGTPDATDVQPRLVRPNTTTKLTITGTGFASGASVLIDGVERGAFFEGPSQIWCLFASTAEGPHSVVVKNPGGSVDPTPVGIVERGSDGEFHPIYPARAFDSRARGAPLPTGTTSVPLSGIPKSGVRAVAVNVTVTQATEDSYLTIFPSGGPQPTASSINFRADETKANMVTMPLGPNGQLAIYNFAGNVHVLLDVVGWYSEPDTTTGGVFGALTPRRFFDSRIDFDTPLGEREAVALPIIVPGAPISAVMLNITATEPTATSFLTAWSSNSPLPPTSNLNFVAGQTVANVVIVPIGPDGVVNIFNFGGTVEVIVDILGLFENGTLPVLDGRYVSTMPFRALDTRTGQGANGVVKPMGAGQILALDLAAAGVPNDATSVVMNLTVADPSQAGFFVVWPTGARFPDSSNLNFSPGQVTSLMVAVPIGMNRRINILNVYGTANVIADITGWYR